jgi:parallel beta helix pectate lyase-like protein
MESQRIHLAGICLLIGAVFLLGAAAATSATVAVNDSSDTLHSLGCAMSGMGTCSLRDAITFANANPGSDVIHFAIPGSGVHTITLDSDLPTMMGDLTIDGYTQSGATPNTNGPGLGDNAVLKIEINGNGKACLALRNTANIIRGLVINRCQGPGVLMDMADFNDGRQNIVAGSFIGLDATGMVPLPNDVGVLLKYRSELSVVGGSAPAARNVISGNRGEGVSDSSFAVGQVIQNNFIGTDVTGTRAVPNGKSGLLLYYLEQGVTITENLISGNAGRGISGDDSQVSIMANLVGSDISGTLPLGNRGTGIWLNTDFTHNVISDNTIAFNGSGDPVGGGIVNFQRPSPGNYVFAPKILRNRIFANTSDGSSTNLGLGIDLAGWQAAFGPGLNVDQCGNPYDDSPTNFPVLQTAVPRGSSLNIQGTMAHRPLTTYHIEFFASSSCDPSGYGEGQIFLGSTDVTTDQTSDCSGKARFDVTLPVTVPLGQSITATATDISTSEFSHCITVGEQIVDGLVKLTPVTTAYNATPVPGGPAGTYSIRAMFTNASANVIVDPVFQVKDLSGGNLLLNADGSPGGVGARLTPNVGTDHLLSPGESFSVEFVIGLQAKKPFTFFVNLLGLPKPL